jgi:ubiquinone/menaquinone biosynthesis C-methylase UbiE
MNNKPVAAGKSSFDLVDTEKVFKIIDPKPDSCFLDLACGVGKYSIEIAKILGADNKIYAIDLWPEGIEFLAGEADSKNLKNIKTILADITKDLPLDDNSIDTCLIATALHDLTKTGQESVINEVARLLRPEATLNIIEFKKIEKGPGPPIDIRMGEEEVDKLVAPYGFEKISVNDVGAYNYLIQFKKST